MDEQYDSSLAESNIYMMIFVNRLQEGQVRSQ